jgi:CubicO group peptidase (beta-lactamase class C family)
LITHRLRALIAICGAILGCATPSIANDLALKTPDTRTNSRLSPAACRQIDSYIGRSFDNSNMVGYALAIIDHGKVAFQKCYGVADRDRNKPVTPQTVFGLASITKTFTALVLLSLVDKGKVDLDASIKTYLVGGPRDWNQITVRELASMTAGFPHDLPEEMAWGEGGYDQAKKLSLLFDPGSNYQYSNVSYRLLGQIIENVSGKPLLQNMKELILTPTSMNSTGIITELRASQRTIAEPYGGQSGQRRLTYRPPAINFASGNLFSNIEDMGTYANALLSRSFVSRKAYQTLWYVRPPCTSGKPDYWAFGWGAKDMAGASRVHKVAMNGGLPGVASNIIIYPEAGVAIVALSNFRSKAVYQIAQNVGKMIFSDDSGPSPGDYSEPEEPGASTN